MAYREHKNSTMLEDNAQVYPRPDFKRPTLTWESLNGVWNFIFDDEDQGSSLRWHRTGLPSEVKTSKKLYSKCKIEVPFVFQTPASGVDDRDAHEVFWYERSIKDIRTKAQVDKGHRLLLRFGAIDYEAKVWVDGQLVGAHQGGHVPFDIDITDQVDDSSDSQNVRLTVRVRDSPYDLTQPRGKQYWRPVPENIFYTPSSGIWQSVWIESVPEARISDSSHGTILRSHDIDSGKLQSEIAVTGRRAQQALSINLKSTLDGKVVANELRALGEDQNIVTLKLPMWMHRSQIDALSDGYPLVTNYMAWHTKDGEMYLALWSPEHPLLYDIEIQLLDSSGAVLDTIHTSVGMRSISASHRNRTKRTFELNGRPYFQALVLDQGYWPKTGMTPPSPDALRADIELSKAMGFNGCRKHQKVEDPIFLYWADRLGYIVWGEMANAFQFSTAYVKRFDAEWREAVLRDINHPCIVTWTPVNESWGYDDLKRSKRQRYHLRSLYYETKTLDPTRPVNDNCGWEHVRTDLNTFHDYADAPILQHTCKAYDRIMGHKVGKSFHVPPTEDDLGALVLTNAPILCTEFGGVNIAPSEGQVAGERDWGYTTASDGDDLLNRVKALVMAVVEGGFCCGFVYTQLTDIEQEVNGLYTFDRKPKLDVEKVREIMDGAKARYFEILREWRDGTRVE